MTGYNSTASLILLLAIFALRKLPGLSSIWRKIPDGWRWVVPTLSGVLAGLVPVVAAHGNARAVFTSLVSGLTGVALPAMGLHAVVKDSPIPIDGVAGGKPKP